MLGTELKEMPNSLRPEQADVNFGFSPFSMTLDLGRKIMVLLGGT